MCKYALFSPGKTKSITFEETKAASCCTGALALHPRPGGRLKPMCMILICLVIIPCPGRGTQDGDLCPLASCSHVHSEVDCQMCPHLVDQLQMAGHPRDGLLAGGGLPQEHGEVVRARRQPLRPAAPGSLIPVAMDKTSLSSTEVVLCRVTSTVQQRRYLRVVRCVIGGKFVRELLSENTHRAQARPKCRQRNSLALL